VLNGDDYSETMINEAPGGMPKLQERDIRVESDYEYGSRAGYWRLFRLFNKHDIKFTMYAVGQAIEANPAAATRAVESGHDIASHGYRWIDYHNVPADEEKALIRQAVESIQKVCGAPPKGWFYGRLSPRSIALVYEVYKELGLPLVWMSDAWADDVPYWRDMPGEKDDPDAKGLLLVPYSYDCNDYRFYMSSGFSGPNDFYDHIKNTCETQRQAVC
jgi:peptidoglycan/xylan/chitin deacetylase (PgdA/CDA1 family)